MTPCLVSQVRRAARALPLEETNGPHDQSKRCPNGENAGHQQIRHHRGSQRCAPRPRSQTPSHPTGCPENLSDTMGEAADTGQGSTQAPRCLKLINFASPAGMSSRSSQRSSSAVALRLKPPIARLRSLAFEQGHSGDRPADISWAPDPPAIRLRSASLRNGERTQAKARLRSAQDPVPQVGWRGLVEGSEHCPFPARRRRNGLRW